MPRTEVGSGGISGRTGCGTGGGDGSEAASGREAVGDVAGDIWAGGIGATGGRVAAGSVTGCGAGSDPSSEMMRRMEARISSIEGS